MKIMYIILFILVFGIPLLKEAIENQNYRDACRRRGDKTYWSTDGLRYTSNNTKVYKEEARYRLWDYSIARVQSSELH